MWSTRRLVQGEGGTNAGGPDHCVSVCIRIRVRHRCKRNTVPLAHRRARGGQHGCVVCCAAQMREQRECVDGRSTYAPSVIGCADLCTCRCRPAQAPMAGRVRASHRLAAQNRQAAWMRATVWIKLMKL